MPWYDYLAHFLAGAFLANGIPHFVQGSAMTRCEALRSPSASTPVRSAIAWISAANRSIL